MTALAPPVASLPLARLLVHAAGALQAVRGGQSMTEALARCPADARPGTQSISFHALRWLGSAQAAREKLAPKKPAPPIDALLLTVIALMWPDTGDPAYADHTLVDQAVHAARRLSKPAAPFVNAVLRRFVRERPAIVDAVQGDLVARFNHPEWWIARLRQDWPDEWEAVLAEDNTHPPMTIRVNRRRESTPFYVERLAAVDMNAHIVAPQGLTLVRPCPVDRLPLFGQGWVSVQDAAAQLAAPLLLGEIGGTPRLPVGARVLDACAAPGGKTAHLLELADLDLLAIDRDPDRLDRVRETLRRLDLKAEVVAADAAEPNTWWDGQPFDAILLDAPCSASGIVRRHPDVRWLRRASDIDDLARTQARLLDALWPLLAPGGRLLYCTCSVFKAEGQDQIDAFLQRQPEARLAPPPASPGHLLPLPDNAPDVTPSATDASPDGFFYALILKV